MHLGEISFCDKVGYNIKSDEYKKKILDDLQSYFGFKVVQKHFEKYSDHSLSTLSKNPHLLAVRTNGNPYLLYLTKYNFANQCIFIDKKIQHGYFYPRMIIAKLWFDDTLFQDTLLDGEMVKTKSGDWEFIISDIISDRRQDMHKVNIVKRISMVYNILANKYREDDVSCCKLRVKKYFTYEELPTMINDFIPSLNYTCRGIYFKPLYLKFKDVLLNFDESLIKKVVRTKYKDITNNTFLTRENIGDARKSASSSSSVSSVCDAIPPLKRQEAALLQDKKVMPPDGEQSRVFYVKKTSQPDIYELYRTDGGSGTADIACVPDLRTSKMLRGAFAGLNLTEKKLFTCSWHTKFNKWIPKSIVENV